MEEKQVYFLKSLSNGKVSLNFENEKENCKSEIEKQYIALMEHCCNFYSKHRPSFSIITPKFQKMMGKKNVEPFFFKLQSSFKSGFRTLKPPKNDFDIKCEKILNFNLPKFHSFVYTGTHYAIAEDEKLSFFVPVKI